MDKAEQAKKRLPPRYQSYRELAQVGGKANAEKLKELRRLAEIGRKAEAEAK